MLFAEISKIAQSEHANSLYFEWGFLAVIAPFCIALFAGLWWLLRFDTRPSKKHGLEVRSVLASMFQKVITQGAIRLFELINNQLPYALSQVDDATPTPSVFDKLCEKMKGVDSISEDRDAFREALEHSLSDAILAEIKKHLHIADVSASGEPRPNPNPTDPRFSLEGETERRLSFIAEQTLLSNRMERGVNRWLSFAFRCFACAFVFGMLCIPCFLIDTDWAFVVLLTSGAISIIAVIAGAVCLVLFDNCYRWLDWNAHRCKSPDDWFVEMSQHRAR